VRGLERGEVAVSGFSRCREMPKFGALMVSTGRSVELSTGEATHSCKRLEARRNRKLVKKTQTYGRQLDDLNSDKYAGPFKKMSR
jgi:hypothetical protein